MENIVAIIGTTSSGKSEYAIKLAKEIDAEIINFDLYQMYKEFDIGTGKIKDFDGVTHHFISFLKPTDSYSIFDFQKEAREKIKEILERNKKVIFVGGSNLYLSAVIFDYQFSENNKKGLFDSLSDEELVSKVKQLNIELKDNFDYKNRRRLIRVLESDGKIKYDTKKLVYDIDVILLDTDREELNIKIKQRIDKMFDEGFIIEVKELLKKYNQSIQPFKAIGYQEIIKHLNSNLSLEECKELIYIHTKQYAKKQRTFMRALLNIIPSKKIKINIA